MSFSQRQKNSELASIGSDYVDRKFKQEGIRHRPAKAKTFTAQSTNTSTKRSKITKEYVQAYEWYQKEFGKSKKSAASTTSPWQRPASDSASVASTRSFVQREPLSPVTLPNTVASIDERRHSTPTRQISEGHLPPFMSSPPSRRVPTFPPTPARKPSRRSVVSFSLPILLATTLIAVCEHSSYTLLRTRLLSDLGLQFTAFFLKATLQVLIIMYFQVKLQREGDKERNERRRHGFLDFMRSQEGKMTKVDQLRAWFGEAAVFDPQFMTKWTDEKRCEFWQYRQA